MAFISLGGVVMRSVLCLAMLQHTFAQSGCTRLPIGSLALSGSPTETAPIVVTPPPLLDTDDFTVEWWLWMGNTAPYAPVMFAFSTTLAVSLSSAGRATLWVSGFPSLSTYAPVQTIWQHWAVVRSGTSMTLSVAGVTVAAQTVAASTNFTTPSLVIGGSGSPDSTSPPPGSLPCLVAEFRVVLGAALYVGSFAPPTQPLDAIQGTALLLHATTPAQLLTDSSPRSALVSASAGVSWNSAAPFSCYPSGSLSFSGAIIRAPPHAAPLELGNWTIEFWISPQSLGNSRIFSIGACCSALGLLSIELQPSGTPAVALLGTNMFAVWPPLYGSWVHMALVRDRNVVAWYVQGKPMTINTVPASANFSASAASPLYIGGDTTMRAYSGLLSNFRVLAGTAQYPIVFPVSTPPLPAVSGTLVLLRAATQAAAFADSSGRGVVVSVVGVSWNASSPRGFGGSLTFSGSTSSIIAFPHASAALGTADFTLEFWINAQSGATVRPFSIGLCCTPLLSIELKSAGASLLVIGASPTTSSYSAIWGAWQHMAIVRLGNRLYWFVQGSLVAVATTAAATNFSASDASPMFVGGDNTTTRALKGLISNFRIVVGIALYPPSFVPPAKPFDATPATTLLLLTNTSAPFADSSSAAITVVPTSVTASPLNPFDVNGSLSFTGSASSIIAVPPAVAAFDTADFTVEFFVNAQSSASTRPFAINASSLLTIEMATSGPSSLCLTSGCVLGSWTAVFGAWHHMAVMRNGTYIAWFVNGRAVAYGAVSPSTNYSASTFYLGGDSTTRVLKGLLSNVRVVRAAIYPALPSMNIPMAFVSGTLVHLSAASSSNPFADASGRGVVVSAVGVGWSAASPSNQTGGSLSFSGSTSSIITIPPAAVQLGTGDFTVEFWVNANLAAYVRPFSIGVCCASALLSIELTQTGASRLVLSSGNTVSSYTAVWGAWQHMALVRLNTSVVWLVNGVQVASATVAAGYNFSASAANPCTLGGDTTFRVLNGSISNFRIVTAAAAFTTPSGALPPIAATMLLLSAANGALPFVDSSGNGVAVASTGVTFSSAGPLDPGPCIASPLITCSQTQSASQSLTSTQTQSSTLTQSATLSQTASQTQSPSPTATPSSSGSRSQSQTASLTVTASGTSTSSVTLTASQTQTQTLSPSSTVTPSPSQTASQARSPSQSQSPSFSATPSGALTASVTQSSSQAQSPSQSLTRSRPPSASSTRSPSQSASVSLTTSATLSPSVTPSGAPTPSQSATQVTSPSHSLTPSSAATPTESTSRSQGSTQSRTPSWSPSTSATASQASTSTVTPTVSQTKSPSDSPSVASSASPSSSPCTLVEVPIALSVSGGVPPSVLVAPAVAVLLRLSFACYFQLPLSSVLVTGALSTDISVAPISLTPSDPANTQAGFCAQVASSGGALRALAALSRHLVGLPTATVSLVAVTCTAASAGGISAPVGLQALLSALQNAAAPANSSATSAPGSSPAPTPPASSLFAAFIAAAAGAASVDPAAITTSAPLVGQAQSRSSPSSLPVSPTSTSGGGSGEAASAGSSSSSSSSSLAVIGGAAAGGAVLLALLVAIGFWLVLREHRRSEGVLLTSAGTPQRAEGGESFVNRMHGVPGGDVAPSEKGVAAVAAFKAARIAAHRAEQEAQADAAIAGVACAPAAASGGRLGSKGARSSRGPVVVKTVFSWQQASDAGDDGATISQQTNPLFPSGTPGGATRAQGSERPRQSSGGAHALATLRKGVSGKAAGVGAAAVTQGQMRSGDDFHGANPLRTVHP